MADIFFYLYSNNDFSFALVQYIQIFVVLCAFLLVQVEYYIYCIFFNLKKNKQQWDQ